MKLEFRSRPSVQDKLKALSVKHKETEGQTSLQQLRARLQPGEVDLSIKRSATAWSVVGGLMVSGALGVWLFVGFILIPGQSNALNQRERELQTLESQNELLRANVNGSQNVSVEPTRLREFQEVGAVRLIGEALERVAANGGAVEVFELAPAEDASVWILNLSIQLAFSDWVALRPYLLSVEGVQVQSESVRRLSDAAVQIDVEAQFNEVLKIRASDL